MCYICNMAVNEYNIIYIYINLFLFKVINVYFIIVLHHADKKQNIVLVGL